MPYPLPALTVTMIGTGIVVLLGVIVAVSVACVILSRNIGGNAGIMVVCCGALFIILFSIVFLHLPQDTNPNDEINSAKLDDEEVGIRLFNYLYCFW